MTAWTRHLAWPVDFSGFWTNEEIFDRIEALRPHVCVGDEKHCWAWWEIVNLNRLLNDLPPIMG